MNETALTLLVSVLALLLAIALGVCVALVGGVWPPGTF